ncbi:hypothetical protein [Anaerosinus massiliensis]|uniref:hypothetical protein n=1 Tax=Massilibacillus massiliensis TaxID=1806837 RepID=UPI000DA63A04|nr:hypothetical protein [Massilibacillus massiliensis]
MSEQLNEADILFAEKEIKIGDETITIKPYSWAQSMKLVKPLGVIMHLLLKHADELQMALKEYEGAKSIINQAMPIIDLLGDIESEELVKALTDFMVTATGKNEVYIQGLMLDDVFELGTAVYDVNKGFFTKRLAKVQTVQPSKKAEKKSQ